MDHSAHWWNRLGKLAQPQHTSYMTQPQIERRGRAENERARIVDREKDEGRKKEREVWWKTKRNHWNCWQGIHKLCWLSKQVSICVRIVIQALHIHTRTHKEGWYLAKASAFKIIIQTQIVKILLNMLFMSADTDNITVISVFPNTCLVHYHHLTQILPVDLLLVQKIIYQNIWNNSITWAFKQTHTSVFPHTFHKDPVSPF